LVVADSVNDWFSEAIFTQLDVAASADALRASSEAALSVVSSVSTGPVEPPPPPHAATSIALEMIEKRVL